jgi:hypothetical protein
MATNGENDPLDWLRDYLRSFQQAAEGLGARPIDEGASWQVEERQDGRFAVVRAGEAADAEPDAVFEERRMALLAAASLTALGAAELAGEEGEETDAVLLAGSGEVREATAEPWAGRLIRGLIRSPAAMELFLEAADPEVLQQAQAILLEHIIKEGGGKIH